VSALIEWYGEQNGAPYVAKQTVSFANELPQGGAFTVCYGFRTVDVGALYLGTFIATWNWTDPAGDTQTFTTLGLAFLGKAAIVGSFTMWKASRDAIPGAVFELVMVKTNILGDGSWDGHFRIV
jgi:hypothetical protein